MQHHNPGKLLDLDLMRAGSLIKEQADVITFDRSTSYTGILGLLHQRIQARSGIRAPSKVERFLCRLILIKDRQLILLEQGSWSAAREMLRTCEDSRLLFMFAIVPRSYRGLTVFERMKRALIDGVDHKICLVEPDLPLHDETAPTVG